MPLSFLSQGDEKVQHIGKSDKTPTIIHKGQNNDKNVVKKNKKLHHYFWKMLSTEIVAKYWQTVPGITKKKKSDKNVAKTVIGKKANIDNR